MEASKNNSVRVILTDLKPDLCLDLAACIIVHFTRNTCKPAHALEYTDIVNTGSPETEKMKS